MAATEQQVRRYAGLQVHVPDTPKAMMERAECMHGTGDVIIYVVAFGCYHHP